MLSHIVSKEVGLCMNEQVYVELSSTIKQKATIVGFEKQDQSYLVHFRIDPVNESFNSPAFDEQYQIFLFHTVEWGREFPDNCQILDVVYPNYVIVYE